MAISIKDRMVRLAYRCSRAINRIRRPLTIGVRALVLGSDGSVLLVRHRYMPGLYLPGGRVRRGESAADATRRELAEEVGLALDASEPLAVHGVFFSQLEGKNDHVIVYAVRVDEHTLRALSHAPSIEVAEVVVARLDEFPGDLSPATRRRLEAFKCGKHEAGAW